MEQQSVNNCLNTNIYSYLETSSSQSYILHLNVVHFFNTSGIIEELALNINDNSQDTAPTPLKWS